MSANNFSRTKSKRPKYRIGFLLISFVLVIGICFAIYMRTGELDTAVEDGTTTTEESQETNLTDAEGSESASDTQPSVTEQTSEVTQAPAQDPNGNPVALCDSVGMDYFNNCLFIGDSVSMGLATYNKIPTNSVYANLGLNISSILTGAMPAKGATGDDPSIYYKGMTVIQAVAAKQPQNVYIMLGSNGISWLSNDFMIDKYKELISEVKTSVPSAKIYVISIPPVATARENMSQSDGKILNADVDVYNSELLKMANEVGIYFVDLNTALKNNDGKLDDSMAANDGMHFKGTTYDTMLEYLMTHVAK